MGRPGSVFLLTFMLAVTIPAAVPADDESTRSPRRLEKAAAYLEQAEESLSAFRRALERGERLEQDNALKEYKRSLSRFHITIGGVRARRGDMSLIKRLVDSLEAQIGTFEALPEGAQIPRALALSEALSHLRGALEVTRSKLPRRSRLSIGEDAPRPAPPWR